MTGPAPHDEQSPSLSRNSGSEYKKTVKSSSEVRKTTTEEDESESSASGRYEKRTRRTETYESTASETYEFRTSAPSAADWYRHAPPQFRLHVSKVDPRGCPAARDLSGEYLLYEIKRTAQCCRWELAFPARCGLSRACVEAAASPDGSFTVTATFEGTVAGPRWRAEGLRDLRGTIQSVFDHCAAENPCAGALWPEVVTATPLYGALPKPPFYISPEPTADETAVMQTTADASCSVGDEGYSIVGPANVPGLSEYDYRLVVPAGETPTELRWSVDKPTAEFRSPGAIDLNPTTLIFKNTVEDWITLKARFKINGVDKTAFLCIALVKINVHEPVVTTPGRPIGADEQTKTVFLVNPPPPPEEPEWVLQHDPGSDCAAFTYNGTLQPAEDRKAIASSGTTDPAMKVETRVTLVAPKERETALRRIQVGYIQRATLSGLASYDTAPAGGRRRVTVPGFAWGLDWLPAPCSPGTEVRLAVVRCPLQKERHRESRLERHY